MKFIISLGILSVFFLGVNDGVAQEKNFNKKKRHKRIEVLLDKANDLYKAESYLKAKDVYESVVKLEPQNAVALFYLELIPEKIEDKAGYEKRLQAYSSYHQALSLYNDKQYEQAQAKFQEIEQLLPDYERVRYYLERIPSDIEEQEQARKQQLEIVRSSQEASRKKVAEEVESLLQEAYKLYAEGKYLEAKTFYREVLDIEPRNNVALFYVECIPQKIKEKERCRLQLQAQNIYQQAINLYQDGRLHRALEKFKEVENMAANYKQTGYFLRNLPLRIKKYEQKLRGKDFKEKELQLERISRKYEEAVSLYKKKDYQAALDKFKEVNQLYPGYKQAGYYLQRIDKDIEVAEIETLLSEANSLYKEKKYAEAIVGYKRVLNRDPKNSVALFQVERIPERIKEKSACLQRRQVNFTYHLALSLYKNKQYQHALDKFKEVNALEPNYKKTEQYISRICRDIKKEEEESFKQRTEANYKEALSLYKNRRYLDALNKFKMVQESRPDYKKTKKYIDRIFAETRKHDKEKEKEEKVKEEVAEAKYNEACSLYNSRDYELASEKFRELDEFYPGYKDTYIYMLRISKELEEDKLTSLLGEAQVLYDEGYYTDAKAIYETILKFQPQNKVALAYLERLSVKISPQDKASTLYWQAISLYEEGKYQPALEKFKEVESILSDYKDTASYLNRISKAILQAREQ